MDGAVGLVFEDQWLVVLNKPPGLSLATSSRDRVSAVSGLIAGLTPAEGREVASPADQLWLVHRLDVGTSGLVLLARDPETHRDLAGAFASRKVEKTYLALVWGHPRPQEGRLDHPLGPDRQDRRRMKVDPAGKKAATRYLVLSKGPHVSLVQLVPETGRTHQIRVHLAHQGHPVVGDDLYGGPRHRSLADPVLRRKLSPSHTFLHAWKLHLLHPVLGEELIFEAPLPRDFQEALPALDKGREIEYP